MSTAEESSVPCLYQQLYFDTHGERSRRAHIEPGSNLLWLETSMKNSPLKRGCSKLSTTSTSGPGGHYRAVYLAKPLINTN